MLTPREIQETSFPSAVFGGYDQDAVDEFLDKIIDDYTTLLKENVVQEQKIKVLVKNIQELQQKHANMKEFMSAAKKNESQLHENEKLVEEQAAALEETGKKLAQQKEELAASNDELNAAKSAVEEAQQELAKEKEELSKLQDELSTSSDELKSANDALNAVREAIEAEKLRLLALTKKTDDFIMTSARLLNAYGNELKNLRDFSESVSAEASAAGPDVKEAENISEESEAAEEPEAEAVSEEVPEVSVEETQEDVEAETEEIVQEAESLEEPEVEEPEETPEVDEVIGGIIEQVAEVMDEQEAPVETAEVVETEAAPAVEDEAHENDVPADLFDEIDKAVSESSDYEPEADDSIKKVVIIPVETPRQRKLSRRAAMESDLDAATESGELELLPEVEAKPFDEEPVPEQKVIEPAPEPVVEEPAPKPKKRPRMTKEEREAEEAELYKQTMSLFTD